MLTSLSSSVLVAPNFFLNPQNNVNYSVAVQTPIDRINSVSDLLRHAGEPARSRPLRPVRPRSRAAPVMRLADIATVYPRSSLESVNHYTVQRETRHRRQRRRPRPGLDRRRHPEGDQRGQQRPADHHEDPDPRPERGDAELVPQPGARHGAGGRAGLCAAGDPVPVLGRSVHHHDGGARRADRHPLDAGADAAPRSTSNR